jgi:hypothetical protein
VVSPYCLVRDTPKAVLLFSSQRTKKTITSFYRLPKDNDNDFHDTKGRNSFQIDHFLVSNLPFTSTSLDTHILLPSCLQDLPDVLPASPAGSLNKDLRMTLQMPWLGPSYRLYREHPVLGGSTPTVLLLSHHLEWEPVCSAWICRMP